MPNTTDQQTREQWLQSLAIGTPVIICRPFAIPQYGMVADRVIGQRTLKVSPEDGDPPKWYSEEDGHELPSPASKDYFIMPPSEALVRRIRMASLRAKLTDIKQRLPRVTTEQMLVAQIKALLPFVERRITKAEEAEHNTASEQSDLLLYGSHFKLDGVRVDPRRVCFVNSPRTAYRELSEDKIDEIAVNTGVNTIFRYDFARAILAAAKGESK